LIISGKVEASESTTLAFKIGGRIESVKYDVGDNVPKGSLMASLDQDEIKAQVEQAKLNYEKMKRDYERVKQLYEENAATKSQFQDMTTGYENASQQLKVADYNLLHSKINAPFNGYVALRRHEPDEMIQAGDPVFIFVSNDSSLKVTSGISGSYISKIHPGAEVDVTSSAFHGSVFKGKVERVGEAADMVTGTFPIEIIITDLGKKMKPGMAVNADIKYAAGTKRILIEPDALVEADEDRGYVYIYNPEKKIVSKTPVKIGEIYGNMLIINEGLNSGDEIVTEGAEFLVSGEKVEKTGELPEGEK
jgi:RND family efflux transporter MFP subunit